MKEKWEDARKEAENTASAGFNRAAEAYERRLEYTEGNLQAHEILLQCPSLEGQAEEAE